jgi:FMN-dependent NADH-azoreductase
MKKLLFVNSCLNRKISRTNRLANELILLLNKGGNFEIAELILEQENILPLVSKTLNEREQLADKGLSHKVFDYAKQFREADTIVIAAPHWDFGFPAILKTYIEAISVPNIVFTFGENRNSIGLCKANKLYYVTTRGGYVGDINDLGFGTIAQMGAFYGIKEVKCISVDGCDIANNDIESLFKKAIAELPNKI